MGSKLQRLGEAMFRLKWWGVIGWAVVLAVLAIIMVQVGPRTSSSLSIPGTSAQQTLDRFDELFPDTGAQSAKVVIEVPEGKTIQDYREEIISLAGNIAKVNEVTNALTPFEVPSAISENQRIGFITVQLKPTEMSVSEETVNQVNEYIDEARIEDVTIVAGGDLVRKGLGEIFGVGEAAGVVIALIVLLVTLGSLIAAGMPIITALVGVGVSMAGLFALSHVIELNTTAPVLAVMLGLAVGIDYSLFIVNRYRTYALDGYTLKESAGKAIGTAGNAVIFAASTVVIALVSLAIVQIPFMTVMGIAAASTVAIAALVAITLIPSLLGIFGSFVFSRKNRDAIRKLNDAHKIHETEVSHSTVWYHWGEFLLRFRKSILIASLAVVALLAWPVSQLQLGLPTDETAAPDSAARQAYDLLVKGFGAGYNAPLVVLAEGMPKVSEGQKEQVRQQIIQQYRAQVASQGPEALALAATPQAQAQAIAELDAKVEQYAQFYYLQQIATNLAKVEGVASAQPALTTKDGTKGVIQVTPTTGPSDEATKELVARLRDENRLKEFTGSSTVSLGITGTTAIQIDINEKLADALPVYLAVVVGLSFIILTIAFRSVLIPLKATLGFLLSVFAMFGALVAVFQLGWLGITDAPGPIVSFIPIIAIGILFGLAMDYEFFLVSGMQEAYHHTKDAKLAVREGFAIGSRVVVAAGLIMVAVFAGFIGNHDSTIQSMGFALALGILVDAFVVRMTIVPIVMSYLDRSAWWIPKWLDKILPKISIEG